LARVLGRPVEPHSELATVGRYARSALAELMEGPLGPGTHENDLYRVSDPLEMGATTPTSQDAAGADTVVVPSSFERKSARRIRRLADQSSPGQSFFEGRLKHSP